MIFTSGTNKHSKLNWLSQTIFKKTTYRRVPHEDNLSSFILQEVLDYLDLDYRNPRNARIYKKFQVIWLSVLFTNNSSQYHDPDN